MTRFRVAIVLCLASLGTAAWAGAPRVRVKGGSGSVTVTGSAAAKQVTGSGRIAVRGDEVEVKAARPDQALTLTIPAAAELEVTTWSGAIAVSGVKGRARLKTVSGSIQHRDGGALECKSVSGAVSAERASGAVEARTVNAPIRVVGSLAALKVSSVSGKIALEGFAGGRVTTSSGGARVEGVLRKGSEGKVVTHSGSIEVVLRAPDGLRYELRSLSGSLRLTRADRPAENATERLSGTVGGGGASLELSSFSGSIRLELKK